MDPPISKGSSVKLKAIVAKPSQLSRLVDSLAKREPMAKVTLLQLLKGKYPNYSKVEVEALVACRQLKIDGETVTTQDTLYNAESEVEIVTKRYVSRGGYKLEKALQSWSLSVEGRVVVDAGSSSGGFTDCLLQHGASLVHAVDVGYNLLDYSLRIDKRVVVHERQNIMGVEHLEPQPDGAVADLSFRSITTSAKHILNLTKEGWLIALIKPQFEVPKGEETFTGVVEDQKLLFETLVGVYSALREVGIALNEFTESPIAGRKGNREFLALLTLGSGLDKREFLELLNQLI